MKTVRFLCGRAGLLWALLALLSSHALAQLANDDCTGAVSLAVSSICKVPVRGTVAGASQSLAPTPACGVGLATATDRRPCPVGVSQSQQYRPAYPQAEQCRDYIHPVSLLNALGQTVRTKTLHNGSAEQHLSAAGLATGIYIVRVVVGPEVLTRKVELE